MHKDNGYNMEQLLGWELGIYIDVTNLVDAESLLTTSKISESKFLTQERRTIVSAQ